MAIIEAVITNPVGLYATPASKLVEAVGVFESSITITYESKTINMKSVMGVLSLGIPHKANVTIQVDGSDEMAAKNHIIELLKKLEISDNIR